MDVPAARSVNNSPLRAPAGLRPIVTRSMAAQQKAAEQCTGAQSAHLRRSTASSERLAALRTQSASLQCVDYPLQTCSSPVKATQAADYHLMPYSLRGSSSQGSTQVHVVVPRDGQDRAANSAAGIAETPQRSASTAEQVAGTLSAVASQHSAGTATHRHARSSGHQATASNEQDLREVCSVLSQRATTADLATQSMLSNCSAAGPPFLPMPPPMATEGSLSVNEHGDVVATYMAAGLQDVSVQSLGPAAC